MPRAFMEIMIPCHSRSISSPRSFLFVCAALAVSAGSAALAGPLQQAEVHKIVNDVRVIDSQRGSMRPAALKDVIAKDLAVRTGIESRAELLFQDNTLTRLGAETVFSFKPGTRDMNLDKGTMLLQVPKGLGGARIKAAAVTAAITGTTIMIENLPNKNVKVLVLEGSLRLSMNGRFGESVMLMPGKMVIVGPKDRVMPQPVTVDISKVVKTSALIDPVKFSGGTKTKVSALPSMDLIDKEISVQSVAKSKGQMSETNLLIQGNGSKVVMATKETMAVLDAPLSANDTKPAASTPGAASSGDAGGGNGSGSINRLVSTLSNASDTSESGTSNNGSNGKAARSINATSGGSSGKGTNNSGNASSGNASSGNGSSGSGSSGSGSGGSGSGGSGSGGSGSSGSGSGGSGS